MKKITFFFAMSLMTKIASAACSDGKTYPVHFTFDDGPHTTLTPKVLDVLKEEKVPATFFVLGSHFSGGKAKPANKAKYDLLDRMQKEGHLIGSHTYEHINHPKYSQAEVKENIQKASQLLDGYLNPPVLRLPYGGGAFRSSVDAVQNKNDMVMNEVKSAGFNHVLWDIDTNDWDAQKRPLIGEQILKDICRSKGGVVLFHDIQSYTVSNLKTWIQAIKAEGHTFEPLNHFMNLQPKATDKKSTTNTAHCEKCQENITNKSNEEFIKSVEKVIQNVDK